MVVLSFSQCYGHGWSWCPQSPLCHGSTWMVCLCLTHTAEATIFIYQFFWINITLLILSSQGSWCCHSDIVVDHHSVHLVANGWDARDGAGKTVWQIPWTGAACFWWKTWSLYRGATTAYCWSRCVHCLYGYGRQITA